ncbi:MAG: DUF4179 domain-containing protein [Syntrophomonadaceae bacterium]
MRAYKDDFDNIAVPVVELDAVVNRAINQGKKQIKIRKGFRIGASAAMIGLCILGSGFVSTTMAKVLVNIPFVGSVFESFADKDLANLKTSDLTSLEDMQITANGVTVAIKEIYYDQSNISIAYLVNGANYTDVKHFNAVFSCNGIPISGGGGARFNQISDKLYSGLLKFYPAVNSELPESFNLEVVLTDDMENTLESPYRFIIPVSRDQSDEKTHSVLVMKSGQSSDGIHILLVKKIVFTPVSTLVEYEYTHPDEPGKPGQNEQGVELTLPNLVKLGVKQILGSEITANQGMHKVRLIAGTGSELGSGGISWHVDKGNNLYTNRCRAYFGASNKVNGDWTLELVPQKGETIKVDFTI